MTTVDRKHPTYRDLLAALQRFNDQDLDMPIKICDNKNRKSHAALDYYHDFNSDAGVDIFDILGLADLLLFGDDPSQAQLFFCDLDSNGMLDIMDLLRLSNIILGL